MALQVSCSALTQWSLTLTLTSAPYPQRVSSSHGKSSSESRSFFLPLLPDPNPPLGYCLPSSLAGVQRHAMPRPAFACPAHVVLCVRIQSSALCAVCCVLCVCVPLLCCCALRCGTLLRRLWFALVQSIPVGAKQSNLAHNYRPFCPATT
ncbi:hypothetical protein CABS01_05349 [Colletotrichum abscissum]|uniref:uncharacterized protein n=1 Tax=Colletotrichum abscissum TaxID=1671311 RepID=UPI0027D5FE8F|nr:uncharacterized protein CABS01_05349 [Colletotrichum abscissum]KAK1523728.1 hypothetical protein CABS01_05349 [Colletotrichum abscissum]